LLGKGVDVDDETEEEDGSITTAGKDDVSLGLDKSIKSLL
jgi:hypothetical protein